MPFIIKSRRAAKPVGALLALATSLALCAAPPAMAAGQVRVRVGDLDLSRPKDEATLHLRAKQAARRICGSGAGGSLRQRLSCRDAVIEEVAQAARAVQIERALAYMPSHPISAHPLSALCWRP